MVRGVVCVYQSNFAFCVLQFAGSPAASAAKTQFSFPTVFKNGLVFVTLHRIRLEKETYLYIILVADMVPPTETLNLSITAISGILGLVLFLIQTPERILMSGLGLSQSPAGSSSFLLRLSRTSDVAQQMACPSTSSSSGSQAMSSTSSALSSKACSPRC